MQRCRQRSTAKAHNQEPERNHPTAYLGGGDGGGSATGEGMDSRVTFGLVRTW